MASGLSVSIAIGATVAASLATAVSGTKGTLGQLGRVAEQLGERHKRVGDIMARAMARGRDVTALRAQYELLGNTLATVERRARALQASMERSAALRQERMALGAEMLGTYMTARAVAMPVMGAINRAAGFEDTMRDIAISGNLTKQEETALGEAIRKAAFDTNQGIDAISSAVGELVNAGTNPGRASEKSALIGKVATAARMDAGGVVELMLAMEKKLEIGDADQKEAFSRLIHASKTRRVGMDELAKAIPMLANDFANAGIKGQAALEQIIASLTIGRNSTGSTEEAVSNLHNWVASMMSDNTVAAYQKAGVDYQKSMQNLINGGYSSYEASLEIAQKFISSRGDAFMKQWKAAGEKGDEEAQQKLMENFGMSELFDRKTIKHLIAMRQGGDEYKNVKADMAGSAAAGALDEDFAKRLDTAKQQMEKLKGVTVDLGIKVGTALLPPVTKFLTAITPMATRLGEFIGAHPGAVRAVVGFMGAILALKIGVLGMGWMFNFFVKSPLNMFGKAINLIAGKNVLLGGMLRGALGGGIKLVGNLILWLGRALLMNPIGLAITAIGVAAYVIYKYWEPIKGFFMGLWGRVKEAFSGGLGGVAKLILDWSPLGLFYKALAGVMSYFGVDMPKNFSEFGANLIGGLVDGIKTKITAAKDAIINFGQNIKGWFSSTLGISSPSKVFAGFGDNIAQGAAIGIGRSSSRASRASADMAIDAFDAASRQRGSGAGAAISGGGVTVHFNPTITVSGGTGIKEQVTEALKLSVRELEQMMARVAARQARTAY